MAATLNKVRVPRDMQSLIVDLRVSLLEGFGASPFPLTKYSFYHGQVLLLQGWALQGCQGASGFLL